MVALPIYVVIQQWNRAAIALATFAVASAILKFTWYDHLGPGEMYLTDDGLLHDEASAPAEPAAAR
jgi:hypothetical protein